MQAVPRASPAEVIDALHRSSDRYSQPDSIYGYGLPDFLNTLRLLEEKHTVMPSELVTAGPNPFTNEILFWFREPPGRLRITVTGANGKRVMEMNYPVFVSRSFRVEGLDHLGQGIYLVKVTTELGERVFKMIRVSR